ncbi:MAG: hypothetical protein JW856_00070, partial [Dehalococcoidales bacterium]|nr:hypothetical protein [Dehalococcoidales bacterium]
IQTVGEVVKKGERILMTLRNFGVKSLQELKERLEELGLSLESQDDNNPGGKKAEEDTSEPGDE